MRLALVALLGLIAASAAAAMLPGGDLSPMIPGGGVGLMAPTGHHHGSGIAPSSSPLPLGMP